MTINFPYSCSIGLSEIKEYTDEDILYKKYTIDKDSLIQGILEVYYDDGIQVFEKAHYQDGKLHGERILYFQSGSPEIIEKYNDDVLVDTVKVYYGSGQLKRSEPYVDGVLRGVLKSYYEDNKLKAKVTYKNNVEDGAFTEYYPNGHLKWEGTFLKGDNEYGELLQYDSTGILVRKLMCDSLAICRTFWTLEKGAISQL